MTLGIIAFAVGLLAATVGMWVFAVVYVPERPGCRCLDCRRPQPADTTPTTPPPLPLPASYRASDTTTA